MPVDPYRLHKLKMCKYYIKKNIYKYVQIHTYIYMYIHICTYKYVKIFKIKKCST